MGTANIQTEKDTISQTRYSSETDELN